MPSLFDIQEGIDLLIRPFDADTIFYTSSHPFTYLISTMIPMNDLPLPYTLSSGSLLPLLSLCKSMIRAQLQEKKGALLMYALSRDDPADLARSGISIAISDDTSSSVECEAI